MSIHKHSRDYNTDTPPVPEALGDVYRPHDLFRDLEYVNLKASQAALDILSRTGNTVMYGLTVTQGVGDTIDISSGVAYVSFTVSVPDSYASNPPTVRNETAIRRVAVTAQTNLSTANAVLNGLTTNYVKVAYAETDVASRQRIKASGTYVYEKEDSFTVTIDTIGPTASEIEIATFTGTAGGSFTITQSRQGDITAATTTVDTVTADTMNAGSAVITTSATVGGLNVARLQTYNTGWVANSDWTNVDLAVTHNLNTPLIDLVVKFFISDDGTDAGAFLPMQSSGADNYGFAIFQQNLNTIIIRTSLNGVYVPFVLGAGLRAIDNESWFYQVRVYKLT